MTLPARTGRASRLPTRLAAAGAGLLMAVLAAAPALASGPAGGTGPGGSMGGGGTYCSGVACYANVWQYIKLSGTPGAYSPAGGSGPQIQLPPPPCYMEPMFSGPQLYTLWKAGSQLPGDPEFPFRHWIPRIKQYKASHAGYWWERVTNLQVGGTCGLPLLAWVRHGAAPPLPAVPAIDLADYAYDHLTLPSPQLKLNPPDHRGYVSLPSYVWSTMPFATAQVTATLGDESATVHATAGNLQLRVGQAGSATVYSSGCTPNGSTASDPPRNAGPGTTPDCGVTFSAPGYDNSITGRLDWAATSAERNFPPIPVAETDPITVYEIQSLNNN
jgi:hypothetical protein